MRINTRNHDCIDSDGIICMLSDGQQGAGTVDNGLCLRVHVRV